MTKNFLMNVNGDKVSVEMSFEELYDQFFKSIQRETWKMVKRYSFLKKDQVEQQYTIELWNAFEGYDISKGQCVSTYIYWRFNKARSDLLYPNIGSKKSKFEKSNLLHLDNDNGSEDGKLDFSNREFTNDQSYENMRQKQPDNLALENELFDIIDDFLSSEEERDLVNVLIDKKNYTVAMYAEKFGITRMGANKRLQKLRAELADFLSKKWI